jgi:hypothetical protein
MLQEMLIFAHRVRYYRANATIEEEKGTTTNQPVTGDHLIVKSND